VIQLTDPEREYVVNRLDRDHVVQVAAGVLRELGNGRAVEACYQPGDGTSYALMFVPMGAVVGGNGGGTAGYAPSRWFNGGTLIVYGQRGSAFDAYSGCDAEYVASELTDNPASALAIAVLLREVLG
jgi:hypothetical protein